MWTLLPRLAFAEPAIVPTRATSPITVDGRLDEPDWAIADRATGFVSYSPEPGQADRGTEALFLVDDDALYVAFRASVDPELGAFSPLVPRDQTFGQDQVGVLLDTFRDGKRAFLFLANGRGVQGDGIFVDGESELDLPDTSWDGVFRTAGHVEEGGYTVEMAIPFRSLRFPNGDEQTWGVVLVQHVPVPWTDFAWPPLSQDAAGLLVQAATLGPFPVGRRPAAFEALPTLTSVLDASASPPAFVGSELGEGVPVDPGVGLKLSPTSSLTVDLALNPDFSQIESDPSQVAANVKYPLYFAEKRPFFLESADLFDTPARVLYTRSIVDPLGGYKLTGRAGPVAIGWLGAYDESPSPSTIAVDYASGEALPTWDEAAVAGARSVAHVVRVRADAGDGSAIGLVGSDKELLPRSGGVLANRVGGVDGTLQGGRYRADAQVLFSQTDFPGGVTRTAPAWGAKVTRSGEHFEADLSHRHLGADFRAENGFLEEVGRSTANAGMGFVAYPEAAWLRRVSVGAGGGGTWDGEGVLVGASAGPELEGSLGDRVFFETGAAYRRERFLGVDFDLVGTEGFAGWQPSPQSFLGLGWEVGTTPHYDAGTLAELYRGFTWQVAPNVGLALLDRVGVNYEGVVDQFLDPEGRPVYTTLLHRATVLVTATPRTSVRVIEQVDTFEGTFATSLLGAWQANYGTAVYLGATDTESAAAPPVRTVFAKVGYLWRP